jgi:hypothetical protein
LKTKAERSEDKLKIDLKVKEEVEEEDLEENAEKENNKLLPRLKNQPKPQLDLFVKIILNLLS